MKRLAARRAHALRSGSSYVRAVRPNLTPSFAAVSFACLVLACGARSSVPGGDAISAGAGGTATNRAGASATAGRAGAGARAGADGGRAGAPAAGAGGAASAGGSILIGGAAGRAGNGQAGSSIAGQAGSAPLPPPVKCTSDAACDDGIACTNDSCNAETKTCEHDACDSVCDDFLFCTGVERCDATRGCVAGEPACALGLSCSKDSCNETTQSCGHDQTAGCAPSVQLLVTDSDGLFHSISAYTGAHAPLPGVVAKSTYLDIAILGERWFAIGSSTLSGQSGLVELVPYTNTIKRKVEGVGLFANSLAAGPDGFLYAASESVSRIDPDTGENSIVATLPPGASSSGDIAFLNGRLFVSTDGPCGGGLAEVDIQAGTSAMRGGDGLGCVYGMASANGVLFLVNCDGTVGTFDPNTGEARLLSTAAGVSVYGADVLP